MSDAFGPSPPPTNDEGTGTGAGGQGRRSPWASASREGEQDDLPLLDDPYLAHRTRPDAALDGGAPELSMLAVSSLVSALALGPGGAVAAIFFGWAARREIDREPSRHLGHGLATLGMALGVVLTMAWAAGMTLGVWTWQHRHDVEVASGGRAPRAQPEKPASTAAPAPPEPVPPAAAAQPGGAVPHRTTLRRIGALEVVDVGVEALTLGEALATQRAEAHALGERVLVMTTRDGCEPCRGVDSSLTDPLMQTALRGVRLIRVDIDVFKDDLDQLKMPRRELPYFFLLSPDLTPRDGINGGEWDDDIARNIAPVLGAFVRGQYTARRRPWQPLPGSGIRL